MIDYFKIGVITSAHGVKGEVNVYPFTDNPKHFAEISECYFKIKGEYVKREITSVKFFKGTVILGFKEVPDRNASELLRQTEIYVDREHADPLEEGEYYLEDILGFEACSIELDEYEEGCEYTSFGVVKDYFDSPAQPIIVIKDNEDNERLIPAIHMFVKKVDLENSRIYIKLIKGM